MSLSIIKAKERDIHNRISGIYDEFVLGFCSRASESYQSFVDNKIVESLEVKRESKILEIGCGTGNLMTKLTKRQDSFFIGLDASINMLETAVGKVHKDPAHFIIADAENLPFQDLVFDRVLARSTLHHLHDPKRSLRDTYRVLKNGGMIVIMEPNLNALMPIGRLIRYILKKSLFKDVVWSVEHRELSVNQMKSLLVEAEFRNISFVSIGFSVPLICGVDWLLNLGLAHISQRLINFAYTVDAWFARIPSIQKNSWHFICRGRKEQLQNRK